MEGFLIGKFKRCEEIAAELGIRICIRTSFSLFAGEKQLGYFNTVDELFSYLCGYDCGYDAGRRIK